MGIGSHGRLHRRINLLRVHGLLSLWTGTLLEAAGEARRLTARCVFGEIGAVRGARGVVLLSQCCSVNGVASRAVVCRLRVGYGFDNHACHSLVQGFSVQVSLCFIGTGFGIEDG